MNHAWSIYALVRADFSERTRRYQYLATIVITLLVGTLLLPSRTSGYETFLIDNYRGVYNSAWIGASYALLAGMLLSLFGFYFVKSAVERDRTTRVGEIIATTSVSRFAYSLGKALSNFLVLASMTGILFVTAVAMQFVRGENASLELAQILAPFALVVLPLIAMVAAIAVFFEMVPWLAGGLGNVAYFFLWTWYLVWSFQANMRAAWWRDLLGGNLVIGKVWPAILQIDPHARSNSIELGALIGTTVHRSFTYAGFHWTAGDFAARSMWFLVAVGVVAAASLLFDRFSKAAHDTRRARPGKFAVRWSSTIERVTTPVIDAVFGTDFGAIVLAELRLLLCGSSFWWYAASAGLWVFQLFADAKGQSIAIGLAWIWPILIWSQLGTRERVYETEQFVYPTLHPIRRQLLAQWVAAVTLALVLAGGSVIHWALSANLIGIEGVLAGAVFVPALALACGAISGTTRLFEIIYLVLWYLGPMNRTIFDFTQGAYAPAFTLASLVLLVFAMISRKWRLRHA